MSKSKKNQIETIDDAVLKLKEIVSELNAYGFDSILIVATAPVKGFPVKIFTSAYKVKEDDVYNLLEGVTDAIDNILKELKPDDYNNIKPKFQA